MKTPDTPDTSPAIIGAGLVTALVWTSAWPDLIVGVANALLDPDAAREVWLAAREDQSQS